jgi:pimeloyl-ACP methyl ester carboxylesterase
MRRLFCLMTLTALVLPSTLFAASVDGIPIHWSSTGQGRTIVFVHGWTCDSTAWAEQVPELAKRYRVVVLDLPGHGRSGSPGDGKFSMDLFARAVEAVRQEAKVGRIALVGHSMGTPVIRQYAKRFPEHVAALVAVDGPLAMRQWLESIPGPPQVGGADGLKVRDAFIQSMFTPQTPVALQQQIRAMMLKAPETTAVGAMAAMFDPAIRDDVPLPMPTRARRQSPMWSRRSKR